MVPTLSSKKLAAVEIGKDFLLSHGYIKNDLDVHHWAAPQLLEQVAKELTENQWKMVTSAKFPEAASIRLGWPRGQPTRRGITTDSHYLKIPTYK